MFIFDPLYIILMLPTIGIVDRTEYGQNKQVLNAAAWTYIAGFAAAAVQLLYYIMLVSGMSRRE